MRFVPSTFVLLSLIPSRTLAQPAADAALPTTIAPSAPAAVPPQPAVAPVARAAGSEPALPTRLAVGKWGFFQPAAQLQFWAYGLWSRTSGKGDLTSGFRLRRAELRAKGEIVPQLFAYSAMIDPARVLEFDTKTLPVIPAEANADSPGSVSVAQPTGAATILQDVILTFSSEYADVSVGQFKIAIGYEAYNSTARLVLPEFSLVTRYYSARRDVGVKVDKKLGEHFYYRADVLNGAGQNRLETDDQKDGSLRFEVYPVAGLTLGVAGYAGLNRRTKSPTKDRLEGDLKVDIANVLLQAEYIHGWDGAAGASAAARAEGHGFYAAAGYKIATKLQPVVRVGYLDPHIGSEPSSITTSNDRVWSYEAGANYFVEGSDLELQLSGGVFDYEHLPSVKQGIFEVQVNF